MRFNDLRTVLPALLGALLFAPAAEAQSIPGFVNLPRDDFVWIWGDREDALANRFSDFTVSGGEAGFRCDLTVKLHPASRLSPPEVRELENDLRTSLAFIQDSAYAMYALEQRRDIDWALLDCDKPDQRELSEAEREERVNRALEKARAEQQRRRERQQRR